MDRTLTLGAVLAGGLVLTAMIARAKLDPRNVTRLFSLEQERVVARAFGPHCMWRPMHRPQGAAGLALLLTRPTPGTALWITALVLVGLSVTELPLVRHTRGTCNGPIERGHQWPAADGGTTRITNLELVCSCHNREQSDTWSWWWAVRQWPWTPAVYGARVAIGTIRLARMRLTGDVPMYAGEGWQ